MLEKYYDDLYNCTRCGICRHWGWNGVEDVCPVYKHTTQYETEYTRGRVKMAKSLVEEKVEPSELLTKHMLECTLCGRCQACCPCKLPLHEAFQAMRTDLADKGFTLPQHKQTAQAIEKFQNPFGAAQKDAPARTKCDTAKVLYYPGCSINRRAPEIIDQVESIFKKLGVDFSVYTEDTCCGFPLYDIGMTKDMKAVAEVTLKNIENYHPDLVITSCPGCLKSIRDLWKEIGLTYDFEVQDISTFLLPKLEGKLERKEAVVTWHDPCVLGRHLGDFETPRDVIRAVPGVTFVEMAEHHEKSACCGAGGGVMSGFYKIAQEVGKDRIAQAEDVKAEELITSCPSCVLNLGRAARKSNVKVRYITELVDEVLK